MLKHHADVSPHLPQLPPPVAGDVGAVDQHGPLLRGLEEIDAPDQRALPCAAGPDDPEDLAGEDVQRDASRACTSLSFLPYTFEIS